MTGLARTRPRARVSQRTRGGVCIHTLDPHAVCVFSGYANGGGEQ